MPAIPKLQRKLTGLFVTMRFVRFVLPFMVGLVGPLAIHAQSFLPTPGELRPIHTADEAEGLEAVGRLDTGVSFCSATLITENLVLTAAHCLFDIEGNRILDADLSFAASLRNGRAEAYRTVARSFVSGEYIPRGGRPDYETVSADLALLELSQPIAGSTITPLPTGAEGRIRDLVTVVSYGRDRENYASIEEDCRILASQEPVQVLSCNVVQGSSGAPILRETGAGLEVIAVVAAVGEWQGGEASIAVSLDTLLPDLLAEYEAAGSGGFLGRTPATVRHLTGDETGRASIGARFVRP